MQIRPQFGGIPYAPNRDMTVFWPDVVKDVARRLDSGWFKTLHDWLDERGVTDQELGEACKAYVQYICFSHEDPDETFEQVLDRSGWFKIRPEAQIAYIFYIGMCTSGMWYRGIRDAMQYGEETRVNAAQLQAYSRRARLYMSLPRWKRVLYKWFKPYRNWLWRRNLIKKKDCRI